MSDLVTLSSQLAEVCDEIARKDTALKKAEQFIAGFEGDHSQEGIDELLAEIRASRLGDPEVGFVQRKGDDKWIVPAGAEFRSLGGHWMRSNRVGEPSRDRVFYRYLGNSCPALQSVLDERRRQNEKRGEQNHDPITWVAILTEEVGEFAQAALHARFGGSAADGLREEAVHCAAVALQIVQCLDRGKWDDKGKEVGN